MTAVRLGWMGLRLHPRFDSVDLIWHNGGTGGFRSWIGFIPAKHAAVVVLSNTARSVDGRAFDLLQAVAFGGRASRQTLGRAPCTTPRVNKVPFLELRRT